MLADSCDGATEDGKDMVRSMERKGVTAYKKHLKGAAFQVSQGLKPISA
jgi:hypothetical protein